MGRVSAVTMKKLTDLINSLPEEAKGKCSLCNETLVHIVKMAEAQTGAGTATVTRALADEINRGAVPGDRVSGNKLRNRVQYQESGVICGNSADKPEPKKEPSLQDQTIYGLNKKPEKQKEVKQYSNAIHFATIAISQLSRIRKEDPKKDAALARVAEWIIEFAKADDKKLKKVTPCQDCEYTDKPGKLCCYLAMTGKPGKPIPVDQAALDCPLEKIIPK